MSKDSKYSRDKVQSIANRIKRLSPDDYVKIINMISEDISGQYTSNSGTVCINMSTISDATLDKIASYLDDNQPETTKRTRVRKTTKPVESRVHQLSNYEKSLIRNRRLNKQMLDEQDYEEFAYSKLKTKN